MMMDFQSLVNFNCTLKIHFESGRPKEHSCKFSLGTVNRGTQPCFQTEGIGIGKPKRMKFTLSNLGTVAAQRISEGRLSITLNNLEWNTIAISDVKDKQSLKKMHEILETIFNGSFSRGATFSSGRGIKSPVSRTPPPVMINRRSPSLGAGNQSEGKKKRLYSLTANPNNWRGMSMVAAAQRTNKEKTSDSPSTKTVSFYGSNTPPPDTFHTHSLGKQQEGSGGKYFSNSARRNLALDLGDNPTQTDGDDFQQTPNYRAPHRESPQHSQRPPLGNLSTRQQRNVVSSHGTLELLARPDADQDGFANLGNTCYMNAVLQSLLGLYPFAEDLLHQQLVKNVHPGSLYRMMVLLLKCKRSKDSFESQRVLLKKIKGVISSHTQKFVGFRQQDAHELLSQCLDQLKDDVDHIGNHGSSGSSNGEVTGDSQLECPSPVVRNFESTIQHRIVCKECGLVTRNDQLNYDFPLQLPKSVLLKPNEQANLQQLFDQFFTEEEVEFNCTNCKCNSATLSHQLTKLPRILILHLKRYGYNSELSKNSKRVDNIRIPRFISVGHLSQEQSEPPCPFTRPSSRLLGQNEDKENLPATPATEDGRSDPLISGSSADTNSTTEVPTCPIQTPTESNHLPICPSQTTFDVPAPSSSGASHPSTTHTPTTLTTHSTPTCTSNNQTRHDDIILVSDSEDDVMECGQQGKNREYHYQPNNATDITRPITIESDFDMLLRQSKATRSCDHSAENMLERSSVTNGTTSGNSKVNPVRLVGLSDKRVSSVLGKRKSYERDQHHSDAIGDLENGHSDVFEGDRFDCSNESRYVDNNTPKARDGDTSETRTVFRNKTFPEGHDLDNGDSCTSRDGLGWCMSKLESGTPLQPSEVEEQEEELIQDKTLEEFDKILSTAPPEFFSVLSAEDENTTSGQDPCGKNFTASHTTLPDSSAPSLTNCASPGLLQVYSTNSPTISPVRNLTNRSSHRVSTPASNLANRGEAQGETCELTVRGERKDLLLSEVNGVRKEVCTSETPLFDFDLEEDDLQKAMEESLKTQQSSEFHVQGMSEEEQLRLALELSIQESLPAEAQSTTVTTPTSSPCPSEQAAQRGQATPTPEKTSLEAYRLVSIVNHIGRGSAGGHYISDVYSFSDHSWRTYNDSQVSEMREETVRQRRQTTGYIFFFMHRSIFSSVSSHFGR